MRAELQILSCISGHLCAHADTSLLFRISFSVRNRRKNSVKINTRCDPHPVLCPELSLSHVYFVTLKQRLMECAM